MNNSPMIHREGEVENQSNPVTHMDSILENNLTNLSDSGHTSNNYKFKLCLNTFGTERGLKIHKGKTCMKKTKQCESSDRKRCSKSSSDTNHSGTINIAAYASSRHESAGYETVSAIDCYVCTSINGGNQDCEDHFTSTMATVKMIHRECNYGLFRASHCTKLKGKREDGSTIVVRNCAKSDWGRHCGAIWYIKGESEEPERLYGCLVSCDSDGCNTASRHPVANFLMPLALLIAIVLAAS